MVLFTALLQQLIESNNYRKGVQRPLFMMSPKDTMLSEKAVTDVLVLLY